MVGSPDDFAILSHGLLRGFARSSVDACLVAPDALAAQRAAVSLMKRQVDALPVLVCTDVVDADSVVTLVRAGADGVVLASSTAVRVTSGNLCQPIRANH